LLVALKGAHYSTDWCDTTRGHDYKLFLAYSRVEIERS